MQIECKKIKFTYKGMAWSDHRIGPELKIVVGLIHRLDLFDQFYFVFNIVIW